MYFFGIIYLFLPLWRTEVYMTKIETRPFIDSLLEDFYVFIVKNNTNIIARIFSPNLYICVCCEVFSDKILRPFH